MSLFKLKSDEGIRSHTEEVDDWRLFKSSCNGKMDKLSAFIRSMEDSPGCGLAVFCNASKDFARTLAASKFLSFSFVFLPLPYASSLVVSIGSSSLCEISLFAIGIGVRGRTIRGFLLWVVVNSKLLLVQFLSLDPIDVIGNEICNGWWCIVEAAVVTDGSTDAGADSI